MTSRVGIAWRPSGTGPGHGPWAMQGCNLRGRHHPHRQGQPKHANNQPNNNKTNKPKHPFRLPS
jgi:hypothetical protein